jgi:hypothetical protein
MKRTCPVCGEEYEVPPFHLDWGCCLQHGTYLISKPLWFVPSPEGTRSLWRILFAMHFIYLCFFSLLLCNDMLPLQYYSMAMVLYFGVRLAIGRYRGYPVLTKLQSIGLALVPLYGPVLSIAIIYQGQAIRFGRWSNKLDILEGFTMNKRDCIWTAIRVFGIYLLVRAIIVIPHFLSSLYQTYVFWDMRHPSIIQNDNITMQMLQEMMKKIPASTASQACTALFQIILFSIVGIYMIRGGKWLFNIICPPETGNETPSECGRQANE